MGPSPEAESQAAAEIAVPQIVSSTPSTATGWTTVAERDRMLQGGSVRVWRAMPTSHDHCAETERPRVYDGIMLGREPQDRLTLTVCDFGPIRKAAINLRPLTVFVGHSNTGKSYLAKLIYALHNLFNAGDDQRGMGDFPRGISSSCLPLIPQAVRARMSEVHAQTIIEWTKSAVDNIETIQNHIPTSIVDILQPHLEISEESITSIENEIMRCLGQHRIQDLIRFGDSECASINIRKFATSKLGGGITFDCNIRLRSNEHKVETSVPTGAHLRVRNFDLRELFRTAQAMIEASERASLFSGQSRENRDQKRTLDRYISRYLGALVRSVLPSVVGPFDAHAYYLPADRTGILHAHRVLGASLISSISTAGLRIGINVPPLSGILTDFLQELIAMDPNARGQHAPDGDLARMIENRILRGSVIVETSDTYPLLSFRPDGSQGDLHLSRFSSMVSELLPVVLYLRFVVRRGDVLIIEEPESHLHPEMQVKLCCEIARLVRSGVRILITTHSELILEQLGNLIRVSELPRGAQCDIAESDLVLGPDDVGVWLFSYMSEQQGTIVKEIALDPDTGLFHVGYGTVREALYNQSALTFNRMQEFR